MATSGTYDGLLATSWHALNEVPNVLHGRTPDAIHDAPPAAAPGGFLAVVADVAIAVATCLIHVQLGLGRDSMPANLKSLFGPSLGIW